MDIAIIGAGNVGRALATSLIRAGPPRDPGRQGSGARPAGRRRGRRRGRRQQRWRPCTGRRQVVVIAVPFVGAASEVAGEIRGAVTGKTIIDVTNPLRPDFSGLAVPGHLGGRGVPALAA